MASLLESRAHQRHARVVSRKAQESNIYDEEPPKRWTPVLPSEIVKLTVLRTGYQTLVDRYTVHQFRSTKHQFTLVYHDSGEC